MPDSAGTGPACDSPVPGKADQLVLEVYEELRRLAAFYLDREPRGQTIQATALVHEAYYRLRKSDKAAWEDQRHFFNAAALAMRRVLRDRALMKKAIKHGGGCKRLDFDCVDVPAVIEFRPEEWEDLERALDEVGDHNSRWREILHLRYLLGLTIEQTAEALSISPATVKNEWNFARAWLLVKIRPPEPTSTHS